MLYVGILYTSCFGSHATSTRAAVSADQRAFSCAGPGAPPCARAGSIFSVCAASARLPHAEPCPCTNPGASLVQLTICIVRRCERLSLTHRAYRIVLTSLHLCSLWVCRPKHASAIVLPAGQPMLQATTEALHVMLTSSSHSLKQAVSYALLNVQGMQLSQRVSFCRCPHQRLQWCPSLQQRSALRGSHQ